MVTITKVSITVGFHSVRALLPFQATCRTFLSRQGVPGKLERLLRALLLRLQLSTLTKGPEHCFPQKLSSHKLAGVFVVICICCGISSDDW